MPARRDVERRIHKAYGVIMAKKPLWGSRRLPRTLKARFMLTIVAPVLLYGCER